MKKPNFVVEDDIREELLSDQALDQSRIFLKAHDGEVTLSGTVDTYPELLRASDDAWKVGGVTRVDNELLVGPIGEAIADAQVERDCTQALDADRVVPHGAVTVSVTNGFVTLRGQVRSHFQRLAAEHAVGQVFGVLGVSDDIAISPEPIPSDVANRINKALARKAVLANSVIEVSNEGHTIYLDGTTDSSAAKREAEETAWAAPGVTDVFDRLVILH